MANTLQTKQEEYAVSMLQMLKEEKGSRILDFAEKAVVSGANTYNFYRVSESQVGGNDINMYDPAYTGNGGTAEKLTATIEYVYASDKIKTSDLNSTSLDLGSTFLKSLRDALDRAVTKKVLDEIKAKTADLKKAGDANETIDSDINVNNLIEQAVYCSTLVKDTSVSEGRLGVALVVDAVQHSKLFRAEKITNNNWSQSNKYMAGTLFGCDVVKVAQGAKDKNKLYLIPAGTYGAASWENDIEAKSEYSFAQDALFCRCKRSLGVVVIEPDSIVEFTHKDPTAPAVGG
jgi:hypothetical protein